MKIKVEDIADKELSKYSDTSIITRKQLYVNIDVLLLDYKTEIKRNLNRQYENFCHEQGIEKKVINLYTDNLQRMIETNMIGWQNIVNTKIQRFFEMKSNMRGNK